MDDNITSAEQTQWEEITAAVRAHLAKMTVKLPEMKPEEISQLVTAIDNAMWTETKAKTFDSQIDERRRSLERQAQYGG